MVFSQADPIDVSVCIANWNCRELLKDCLKSLHRQSQGVRLQTIVADNGSVDGAADMVAELFPEIVLIRNVKNLGFSRANNQAAAQARGRYLFFLNNDTVVPPQTLGRLLTYAQANPHVGMIGPRLRDAQGQTQISYRQKPTLPAFLHRLGLLRWTGLFRKAYHQYRREDFDPEKPRTVETLMGAALFLSREVFQECGPWDEDFVFGGEDLQFSLQIGRRHPLVYLPSVEITHFGRVSSRQHIGYVTANMTAGQVCFLRKTGYSPLSILAYKLAVSLDLPLQLIFKTVEYLSRYLRGRDEKAQKSLRTLRGLSQFLFSGMLPLWKA